MKGTFEQIILHLFGVILGAIGGVILLSFGMNVLRNENHILFIVITSLIGFLISFALTEYNKSKFIKKSNAVRNEAIALISHEMRTGLTSTSWAIQMILEKYGDSMSAEDKLMLSSILESIHATVMHSVNLLDVSILDISMLAISLEWVSLKNIEQMFTEVVHKYEVGTEKKNIEFVSHIKLDPTKKAEVDILRLRIIVENLLENAIQYSLNDKKAIELNIENTDKAITIKITDKGIGIPVLEQKNIFKEFYRASNAKIKLSSGSGIGLYLSHQYVTAHHGTIRFESEENKGTTFYITIPLKTEADVNDFLQKI